MTIAFRKQFRGYNPTDVERYVTELHGELDDLRARLQQAEVAGASLAQMEKAKRTVEVELAAVQRERRDLMARERLLVGEISEYEKKAAEWAEVEGCLEKLSGEVEAYEQKEREWSKREGEIAELVRKVVGYEQQEAEWAQDKARLETLASQLGEYQVKAKQWADEAARLQSLAAKAAEYERQIAEWEEQRVAEYERQAAEWDEARARMQKLNAEVESSRARAGEWQQERERLVAEIEELRQQLQVPHEAHELDNLRLELGRSLERVAAVEAELLKTRESLAAANDERTRLLQHNMELLQEKDRYTVVALDAQKQYAQAQQEATRMEYRMQEFEEERERLVQEGRDALQEIIRLKDEVERLEAELGDYRHKEVAIGQAYILARHHLHEAEAAANEVFRRKISELGRIIEENRHRIFEELLAASGRGGAPQEASSPGKVLTLVSNVESLEDLESEPGEDEVVNDKWYGLLLKLRENLQR